MTSPNNKNNEIICAQGAPVVDVIEIINPFDPMQHTRSQLSWDASKTLCDYFPEVTSESNKGAYVVSINGGIVEENEYPLTYLSRESSVIIAPIPQGADKNVLRIVALISVAVLAGPLAGAIATKFSLGAVAAGFVTAGITVAGTLIVNALLPPAIPGNNFGGDVDDSPSYGIDGPKNTSSEGVPVPIVYGGYRVAGNIIQLFTRNLGNTQILFILINAGEGPVAGLRNIKLNDQPITNFTDWAVEKRDGEPNPDQDIIPWFDEIITPQSVGVPLDTNWLQRETNQSVDKIRFDVTFPNGLFRIDDKGRTKSVNVNLIFEYRLKDSGNSWESIVVGDVVTSYTTFYHYYRTGFLPSRDLLALQAGHTVNASDLILDSSGRVVGEVRDKANYETTPGVSAKSRSAVRRSYETPELPEGIYETRTRRTTGESADSSTFDQVQLTDINQINTEKVTYANSALLGLKIKLTDQLTSLPTITYFNGGVLVRVWNGATEQFELKPSANPAWIALDVLTNTRYGGEIEDEDIDMIAFRSWAAFCDSNGFTFKGVLDSQVNLWDALQPIFRAGHAQIVNVGTRYTVAVDKQDMPKMMFGVGEIIEDTFEIEWLPLDERANAVEVTYYDEDNDNKATSLKVYDENRDPNDHERVANINMIGVTDKDVAVNEARLILNLNRYISQTIKFEAPVSAIAVTVGDVIYVQHDMPQWGFAGKLVAGSTASQIELDREISMSAGNTYKLLLHHSTLQIASGTVSGVNGNVLILDGYDGTTEVKRIVINGEDREVTSYSTSAGGSVTVADVAGISVTDAYVLHDTDVIEEREVINSVGDHTSITVTSPFSIAPAKYTNWLFGEDLKVKKPFRVVAIELATDFTRQIRAIEYNDSIYDFSGQAIPTPNFSSLPTNVAHVTIDDVEEELVPIGGVAKSKITVHWSSSQSNYRRAEVFVSFNGGEFQSIGTHRDHKSFEAAKDDELIIKVVAENDLGVSAPFSSAPTFSHVAQGKTVGPQALTNLTAQGHIGSVLMVWINPTDFALKEIIIFRHTSDDQGAAQELERVSGSRSSYLDETAVYGVTYYYWVRPVDSAGNIGDFNALAGESAVARKVENPDVEDAAIGNAQIFGAISSSDYVPGTGQGWQIDKEGGIEASNITIRDDEGNILLASGGELSELIDNSFVSTPAWFGNFDGLFSGWELGSGNTLVQDPDAFGASQAGLIGSTNPAPVSSGLTDGVRYKIPLNTSLALSGKRIKVTVYAKQPSVNATSQFALAYSTNSDGNSGWNNFTPTASYAPYSFFFEVPDITTATESYISVWADTAATGKQILIDRVVIETGTAFIDSNNVDTYIGSAAIKNLQVAVAAIDTLEIAGQAVSVPVTSYIPGTQTELILDDNEGWNTLMQVSITTTGQRLSLTCSGYLSGGNAFLGDDVDVRLVRNGAQIKFFNVNGLYGHYPSESKIITFPLGDLTFSEYPGPGTYIYTIQFRINHSNNTTFTYRDRFMELIETKR